MPKTHKTEVRHSLHNYQKDGSLVRIKLHSGEILTGGINRVARGVYQGKNKNNEAIKFKARDVKTHGLFERRFREADYTTILNSFIDTLDSSIQRESNKKFTKLIEEFTNPAKKQYSVVPFTMGDFRTRVKNDVGVDMSPNKIFSLLRALTHEGKLHQLKILTPRQHANASSKGKQTGYNEFYSPDLVSLTVMKKYYDDPNVQEKIVLQRVLQGSFGRKDKLTYLQADWIHEHLTPMLKEGTTDFHMSKVMLGQMKNKFKNEVSEHMTGLLNEGKSKDLLRYTSKEVRLKRFISARLKDALRTLSPRSKNWNNIGLIHIEKGTNPNPDTVRRMPEVNWYCLNNPESIKSMRKKLVKQQTQKNN